MSILYKSPEPLSFTGNVAQNWREFAEQLDLQWFLEGTESTEKGDKVKIGIMLSHAGKEGREIYRTLPWACHAKISPPKVGSAGPILAEKFAKIGPPRPLLLPKQN